MWGSLYCLVLQWERKILSLISNLPGDRHLPDSDSFNYRTCSEAAHKSWGSKPISAYSNRTMLTGDITQFVSLHVYLYFLLLFKSLPMTPGQGTEVSGMLSSSGCQEETVWVLTKGRARVRWLSRWGHVKAQPQHMSVKSRICLFYWSHRTIIRLDRGWLYKADCNISHLFSSGDQVQ